MNLEDARPSLRVGALDRLLFRLAAVDEAKLRQTPQDKQPISLLALVLAANLLFEASVFSLVSHRLFAPQGQLRPELIAASVFLASFIILIDLVCVIAPHWHKQGEIELRRGGLVLPTDWQASLKSAFFLTLRLTLSFVLSALTGICFSLIVFATDITRHVEAVYMQANARLIAEVTPLIDAEIKRAAEAEAAQRERVAALAAQVKAARDLRLDPFANDPQMADARQEVARLSEAKANADEKLADAQQHASDELGGKSGPGLSGVQGLGPRRRAAMENVANAQARAGQAERALEAARKRLDALRDQSASKADIARQQAGDQLPGLESALAAETEKLAELRGQSAKLTQGRSAAIRDAVEQMPEHVKMDDGLIAQVNALDDIARENPKLKFLILLVELAAFGFEAAAILAKMTSVPTIYAAIVARDHHMGVVRLVDGMAAELNRDEAAPAARSPMPPPSSPPPRSGLSGSAHHPANPFDDPDNRPPQPPRRPRGRPRKTLN